MLSPYYSLVRPFSRVRTKVFGSLGPLWGNTGRQNLIEKNLPLSNFSTSSIALWRSSEVGRPPSNDRDGAMFAEANDRSGGNLAGRRQEVAKNCPRLHRLRLVHGRNPIDGLGSRGKRAEPWPPERRPMSLLFSGRSGPPLQCFEPPYLPKVYEWRSRQATILYCILWRRENSSRSHCGARCRAGHVESRQQKSTKQHRQAAGGHTEVLWTRWRQLEPLRKRRS